MLYITTVIYEDFTEIKDYYITNVIKNPRQQKWITILIQRI